MEDNRICLVMEDGLSFWFVERRPQLFWLMEDDLKFVCKWKTTPIIGQMESNLNLFCSWKTMYQFYENFEC